MQKTPYVFPIIGGRKVEHLIANLEALDISLSDEHIKEIDNAVPFIPSYPYKYCVSNTAACLESVNAHITAGIWYCSPSQSACTAVLRCQPVSATNCTAEEMMALATRGVAMDHS